MTKIELPFANLSGTLISMPFDSLELLNLSNNDIIGDVSNLKLSSEIKILKIDQNERIGGDIKFIEPYSKLLYFNCDRNLISGTFPNLDTLENLQFFSCNSKSN